jgi:hypothetical protein
VARSGYSVGRTDVASVEHRLLSCPNGKGATRPGVSEERWAALTLDDQIGNLGTDVARAVRAKVSGAEKRLAMWLAIVRTEFEMTVEDPRWELERAEIERQRSRVEDFLTGPNHHGLTPESLDAYFYPFAVRSNEARWSSQSGSTDREPEAI